MTRIDGALISAVKYFRPKSNHSEDLLLSSIHYKVAFGIILACAILTGLTSWYSPIECTRPSGSVFDMSYVRQKCYAYSSYIIEGPHADEGIFHGIINRASNEKNSYVYVNYYQWVTLCLVIQAASFQVPRVLWKALEGGRTRKLVEQFRELEAATNNVRVERIILLAQRLQSRRQNETTRYFYMFLICQAFYFFNVIIQFSLTQNFLNGQFISLVPKWLKGMPVLNIVFPKAVKCDLESYGSGGSTEHQNVICILAINVLNEKIYILLWVVFMLALVTAILQLVYVTVMATSENLRNNDLEIPEEFRKGNTSGRPLVTQGEWLLLRFLKSNLDDSRLFENFISEFIKNRIHRYVNQI